VDGREAAAGAIGAALRIAGVAGCRDSGFEVSRVGPAGTQAVNSSANRTGVKIRIGLTVTSWRFLASLPVVLWHSIPQV
jgi:hypothetical protein